MNGKPILYLDQYGNRWQRQIGGRVSKMYQDKPDGRTVHVGYVVGQHWCTAYAPVELPA